MRKAHEENINNLFDFHAEDNIDNVSTNEKPSITKRFKKYARTKGKDSISTPILKSDGVEITDPKLKEGVLNAQYTRPRFLESPLILRLASGPRLNFLFLG